LKGRLQHTIKTGKRTKEKDTGFYGSMGTGIRWGFPVGFPVGKYGVDMGTEIQSPSQPWQPAW